MAATLPWPATTALAEDIWVVESLYVHQLISPTGEYVVCRQEATERSGGTVRRSFLDVSNLNGPKISIPLGEGRLCHAFNAEQNTLAFDAVSNLFVAVSAGSEAHVVSFTPQGALRWDTIVPIRLPDFEVSIGGDGMLYVVYRELGFAGNDWLGVLDPVTGSIVEFNDSERIMGTSRFVELGPAIDGAASVTTGAFAYLDGSSISSVTTVEAFHSGDFGPQDSGLTVTNRPGGTGVASCAQSALKFDRGGSLQWETPLTAPFQNCHLWLAEATADGGLVASTFDWEGTTYFLARVGADGSVTQQTEFPTDLLGHTDRRATDDRGNFVFAEALKTPCVINGQDTLCYDPYFVIFRPDGSVDAVTEQIPGPVEASPQSLALLGGRAVITTQETNQETGQGGWSVRVIPLDGISTTYKTVRYYDTIGAGPPPPPPPPPTCGFGDVVVVGIRGTQEMSDADGPNGTGDGTRNNSGRDNAGRYGRWVADELSSALEPLGVAVSLIGVDYPAAFPPSYGGSVDAGEDGLRSALATISSACEVDPAFVLVGYSQGGHVVHSFLNSATSTETELIAAAGLIASPTFTYSDASARGTFRHGDTGIGPAVAPLAEHGYTAPIPSSFQERTHTWCLRRDPVCTGEAVLRDLRRVWRDRVHSGSQYQDAGAVSDLIHLALWSLEQREIATPDTSSPAVDGALGLELLRGRTIQRRGDGRFDVTDRVWLTTAATVGVESTVLGYEWDLNNDGLSDLSSLSPTLEHNFTFIYDPAIRGPIRRQAPPDGLTVSVVPVTSNGNSNSLIACYDPGRQRVCR